MWGTRHPQRAEVGLRLSLRLGSQLQESLHQCRLAAHLVPHDTLQDCGVCVSQAVRFFPEEQCAHPDVLHHLWLSLGLESSLVDELVRLRVVYHKDSLQVLDAHSQDPELHETLHHCLVSALRIRRFTSSRWCSMGASCRQLLASLLLGLGAIVEKCFADPEHSDFRLNGFKMLDSIGVEFTIVCAISSYVADAALAQLLSDSRVPLTLAELEQDLRDEMELRQGLQDNVYEVLTFVCPSTTAAHLRSQVLSGRMRVLCLHFGAHPHPCQEVSMEAGLRQRDS